MPSDIATQPRPVAEAGEDAEGERCLGAEEGGEIERHHQRAHEGKREHLAELGPLAGAASSSPASRIQALAKSSGEYQAPPTTKLTRAATMIAG